MFKHARPPSAPLTMAHNPLQGGEHRLGMTGINLRPHFAPGGMPIGPQAAMAYARRPVAPQGPPVPSQGQREPIHTGAINVPVAGRTDHVPITVPMGAYVIPADVVNGHGQDNSLAGLHIMEELFKGGTIRHIRSIIGPNKENMPIAAAGGEYVVPPETLIHMFGSVKKGHTVLDAFVKSSRADHIKTLKRLPPPKK